jgi:hypothetical protein
LRLVGQVENQLARYLSLASRVACSKVFLFREELGGRELRLAALARSDVPAARPPKFSASVGSERIWDRGAALNSPYQTSRRVKKDETCRFLVSCGGAKVVLGEAENGSRTENCNSKDPRAAAWGTLNRSRESKMEIPIKESIPIRESIS